MRWVDSSALRLLYAWGKTTAWVGPKDDADGGHVMTKRRY
jgi:hypothetical protein